MQKRLLLASARELHVAFKKENENDPHLKIGRSKFSQLKPPWCVAPDTAGTHNVCVCIHHQNPKLMISAMHTTENTRSLLSKVVFSLENEDCVLRKCKSCPSPEDLVEHLKSSLAECETVSYKQWVHTDRTQLVDITESLPHH